MSAPEVVAIAAVIGAVTAVLIRLAFAATVGHSRRLRAIEQRERAVPPILPTRAGERLLWRRQQSRDTPNR